MPRLLAVIKREFRATAANKTFVIMTILGPFLILAITLLPTLLANNPRAMSSGKPVAILVSNPAAAGFLMDELTARHLPMIKTDDPQTAREKVLTGEYAGFVEVPAAWPKEEARYFTKTGTEATLFGSIDAILASFATQLKIAEAGLSAEQASALLSKPAFRIIKLGADQSEETKTQDDFLSVMLTAVTFVMIIYMTVLLYGQMIGRSVVQEKSYKTVEIILSSLSTQDLMFGKIFGLGLASLLQYAVWIGMGTLMVSLVGPVFKLNIPAAVSLGNFFWLAVFFILAFFLYAAAYAVLGSAAEDEHHLAQLAWPLLLFLIVPMILISNLVMSPDSPVALILSLFPLTSPIVMLVRVLVSNPAWWELALCIGLLVAATYITTILGAKIFRVGILMSGKRHTPREILRWLRIR